MLITFPFLPPLIPPLASPPVPLRSTFGPTTPLIHPMFSSLFPVIKLCATRRRKTKSEELVREVASTKGAMTKRNGLEAKSVEDDSPRLAMRMRGRKDASDAAAEIMSLWFIEKINRMRRASILRVASQTGKIGVAFLSSMLHCSLQEVILGFLHEMDASLQCDLDHTYN